MLVEGADHSGDGSEVGAVASVEVSAEVPVFYVCASGDSGYVLGSGDAVECGSYERGAAAPGHGAEAGDDASPAPEAPVGAAAGEPGVYRCRLPQLPRTLRVRSTLARRASPLLFVSSSTSMPFRTVKQMWHLVLARNCTLSIGFFMGPTLLNGSFVSP